MTKGIRLADLRHVSALIDNGEISMSRGAEMLNEIARERLEKIDAETIKDIKLVAEAWGSYELHGELAMRNVVEILYRSRSG
jgi:hypothetical protein